MERINLKTIAKDLLEIKAVYLSPKEPFTWASGLKSPIYCDNRVTLSFPKVRREIGVNLAKIIKENFPEAEVIAGTATAGIPHAAIVAEILELPMIYVRSKPKDHGKGNQIEGQLLKKQKVVLIDDLISTGGSVLEACAAVEKAEGEVLGVAGIFSYELPKGKENFAKENIPLVTLTNYSELLTVAMETDYITEDQLGLLSEWRKDPKGWSDHFTEK